MRLLLDTHAVIWWWMDDPILRDDTRKAMADAANEVFVSAATGWEIATKVRKGQLPELRARVPTFHDDIVQERFRHLPITVRHGVHGGSLPGAHKDPFDRLIAAQALLEGLTVVTRDPEIAAFGCEVLW
ncbi:MAG TPA: type II toxin-antitoxin system VapC family toxin [Sphingomonas sp.]|jgi:PIN domain nuclease of toxin-antitoxin system|uniref:type II toxin-antitoxin system VapC family toxin n=1 Tax=Sphingomonas sp. TaxID=28214 RepID=UPI002ED9B9CA